MMIALNRYAVGNVGIRVSLSEILTGRDFVEFVNAESIGGAWAVLENTEFGAYLPHYSGQPPVEVERLLHLASGLQFRKAIRNLGAKPRAAAAILLSRWDLDGLILTLRRWHGKAPAEDGSYNHYPELADRLPVSEILKAVRLADIAKALRRTPYGPVLLESASAYDAHRSLFVVEAALERNYYERLLGAVRALGGSDGRDAESLIGAEVDALNLAMIARRLHYYHEPILGDLNTLLLSGSSSLGRRLADPGLTAETFDNIFSAHVARSFPGIAGKLSIIDKVTLLETMIVEFMVDLARESFTSFPYRFTCVLALYILKRVELKNLRAVFAGMSSGLSEEAILSKIRGLGRSGGDSLVSGRMSPSSPFSNAVHAPSPGKMGA